MCSDLQHTVRMARISKGAGRGCSAGFPRGGLGATRGSQAVPALPAPFPAQDPGVNSVFHVKPQSGPPERLPPATPERRRPGVSPLSNSQKQRPQSQERSKTFSPEDKGSLRTVVLTLARSLAQPG